MNKKLNFEIRINAPKEKVWKTLWDDKTYRQWTSVFSPDSHAKSDWKEGSRIEFGDGKGNGMFSLIEKKTDNVQMTFKHLGELKDGEEKLSDWGDARESYFLSEHNGQTDLKVELDSVEEFLDFFKEVFPKALQLVKQISEK